MTNRFTMHPKFSLLIFDLDGTLVDSQRDLAVSVNFLRKNYGKPPVDLPTLRTYIGNGVISLVERALPGINEKEKGKAVAAFRKHYEEHLLDTTGLFPGIREVLEASRKTSKAVLTNKSEIFSRKILAGLGVIDYFEVIWGGDTGPRNKPSPEPIIHIAGKTRIELETTLMIGDGVNDILSARAAGVSSCAVGWGYTDKSELLALKPDYFAETPLGLKSQI
jgi:phosphoglycolate phosphatase